MHPARSLTTTRASWLAAPTHHLPPPPATHSPPAAGSDDIYSSYRRIRSDSYKDMILTNMGKSGGMSRGGR
jgi:hypothetical protein